MEKIAVIVAGGMGTRMGVPIPKQFLLIHQQPILCITLQTFLNAFADLKVVLVVPESHLDASKQLIATIPEKSRIQLVLGGATRFHSVQNGLKTILGNAIVFVHDAVRCLVSVQLIRACYEQAMSKGSAIPAVTATDSLRWVDGENNSPLNRAQVMSVQTPQTFQSNILLPAYQQSYQPAFTDEATVVEANGVPVHLIEGEYRNLKITRPEDLLFAEQYLAQTLKNN